MCRRGQRHRSPWLCGWNPHWHAEWDGERATLKLSWNCFEARNFSEMKLCYCNLWKFNTAITLKAYWKKFCVVIHWLCCMKLLLVSCMWKLWLHNRKTFKKGIFIVLLGFWYQAIFDSKCLGMVHHVPLGSKNPEMFVTITIQITSQLQGVTS